MTSKRYINLLRAVFTEAAKTSNSHTIHKGWEKAFRRFPKSLREANGRYCYEEMFNISIKPLAHKYGIGGY